jgi:hypothetical protein
MMIPLLVGIALSAGSAQTYWEVQGVRIPRPRLTIERESKRKPPAKPNQPVHASDVFKVATDLGAFQVQYSRYLNAPPACRTSDMGLGIPGLGRHWYRGNTIRVLLDDQDVVARVAADAVQTCEQVGRARFRFLWKLEQADVAIHVLVVNGRSEGFVEVAITPHRPLKRVGVNLLCYPGGYGPAYGHPSRRLARTPAAEIAVASGQKARVLGLPRACPWVWFADRDLQDHGLYNTGGVGLVLLPEDKAKGKVTVSSYGVYTRLTYPGSQTRVRLALVEYPGPNAAAFRELKYRYKAVARILRKLEFWP